MSEELKLAKGTTALLMADFHTDSMGENPIVRERRTFDRAKEVLDAARDAGVFVAYIVVNFRPGFPEISNLNKPTINVIILLLRRALSPVST